MKLQSRNQGSYAVLRLLKKIYKHNLKVMQLNHYNYGWERGFVLSNLFYPSLAVTFSEDRRSDDIVVYELDWNDASDSQREKAYESRQMCETPRQAAVAIVEAL